MSSSLEDSVKMDESPVKSDAEKSDSKKGINKPRRRGRRGKRRKQRKGSGDSQPGGSGAADGELDWDESNEEEEPSGEAYSGQMLRPNAPHAPKNSTQFIIDDHNECRLYMSFETPNPYADGLGPGGGPIGEDAAYIDVDYQYESPQDFDNTAYYDREFELSYKSNRFEELLRLPRERLIGGLRGLEQRLRELSEGLLRENPSPVLEQLQHQLLELQEKHEGLREANARLTHMVGTHAGEDIAASGGGSTEVPASDESNGETQLARASVAEDGDVVTETPEGSLVNRGVLEGGEDTVASGGGSMEVQSNDESNSETQLACASVAGSGEEGKEEMCGGDGKP